ncbi:transposase, partial [bacterium]|nr:transposase [bacterium]
VRRSQPFAGHASEGKTLDAMLTGLNAPKGAMVIMEAGIATEANLRWLRAQGYRYLVVRRGGQRPFDEDQAVAIQTAGGQTVRLQKDVSEDEQEVQLYGHSLGREAKEKAMSVRFAQTLEAGLQKIVDGLAKPRAEKRYEKLLERVGRLKEKSHGAGQHYVISWTLDEAGKNVTALTWERQGVPGTQASHPGVYCLRSNELSWDEERLWRTHTMLTDLEAVFRSLKSELGLRPIFHSKEDRSDGHLFITVLAYQCVQVIR